MTTTIASTTHMLSTSTSPLQHVSCPTSSTPPLVYFFLDFSNITISAKQIAVQHRDSMFEEGKVRLHCKNLRRLVQRDRVWGSGFAAAGLHNQESPIKRHFEREDIEFHISERGLHSGTEQNVDVVIQHRMLRLLHPDVERGVVVLATGDGNGHQSGEGFLPVLDMLLLGGHSIEVMSWRHSFNSELRAWAAEHGRVIELDDHYLQLTFIDGGRRSDPLRGWKYRMSA